MHTFQCTGITFSYPAIMSKICFVSGNDVKALMNSPNKLELAENEIYHATDQIQPQSYSMYFVSVFF